MAKIIQPAAWEQTQELCPECEVEVALAHDGDLVEATCDCIGYLVA